MGNSKHGTKVKRGTQAGSKVSVKYTYIRKRMSEKEGLESGVLIMQNGSSWFRRGEKKNWETRKKFDSNGKTKTGFDLSHTKKYITWKRKH